ncbi:MAG: class I SAM-dependent methyltransferase [Acidimicrobiales bacterium]|nr:class I SAM-dependent methyltransferase [Acidimicrobiales bacterium]
MTTYEAGSFRDPDSAVFRSGGKVLRGLSGQAADDWDRLSATTFFPELVAAGQVVRTTAHEGDAPPSPRGQPWARVIEHERIPVVSYPYEWPFAMMREAAALHLDVLAAALDEGMSLKDGTAYNVQFVGARPTFIDIGSFEQSTGPWPGYRQFCQTMLFPLMVQAHLGVPFQPLLRGSIDGLTPSDVAGMFSGLRRFRKGVLRNVTLHSVLERKVTTASETVKSDLKSSGFSNELAKATVKNLRKLVGSLEVAKRGSASDDDHSVWSDYRDTCSYSDDDARAKQAFVRSALDDGASGTVLDLGANDGAYSLLAAEHADYVVAVDGDEKVVDLLYRRLRAAGKENVLPLVMNLVDPSGGIGWRNRERAPFVERVRPDATLALALIHHLTIAANVPLPEVVSWLASFGGRVVVEFPHVDDVQVKRLLANKPAGLFDDYRREAFEALLEEQFLVHRQQTLPGGTRTMYLAEPKP